MDELKCQNQSASIVLENEKRLIEELKQRNECLENENKELNYHYEDAVQG